MSAKKSSLVDGRDIGRATTSLDSAQPPFHQFNIRGARVMARKKSLLSAAIAASLGLAAPIHAQQTDDEVETVVVIGYRASLEQALQTKRNANSVVEAL